MVKLVSLVGVIVAGVMLSGCSNQPSLMTAETDAKTSASSKYAGPDEDENQKLVLAKDNSGYQYLLSMYSNGSTSQIMYKKQSALDNTTNPENTWPEDWSNISSDDIDVYGELAAAGHSTGDFYVFTNNISTGDIVYKKYSGGTWSNWYTLPSSNGLSNIKAIQGPSNYICVYGITSAQKIRYYRLVGGTWNTGIINESGSNSTTTGILEVTKKANGRIMVIIQGTNRIYQATMNSSSNWTGVTYQAVSGSIGMAYGVKAILNAKDSVQIVVCDYMVGLRTSKLYRNSSGQEVWSSYQTITTEFPSNFCLARDVQASPDRLIVAYKFVNSSGYAAFRQQSDFSWTSTTFPGDPNIHDGIQQNLNLVAHTWPTSGKVSFYSSFTTAGMLHQEGEDCGPAPAWEGWFDVFMTFGTYSSLGGWRAPGGNYGCIHFDN